MQRLAPLNATVGPPECNGWPPTFSPCVSLWPPPSARRSNRARRSVREAARQHCVKTASSGPKNTTVKHWLRWSARHKWVSRSLARDEWIARTSDDQIVSNVTACKLALTTRALDYLTANDGADFLRAARALSLHFPPIQRVRRSSPLKRDPLLATLKNYGRRDSEVLGDAADGDGTLAGRFHVRRRHSDEGV